jgi:hypothetical protein
MFLKLKHYAVRELTMPSYVEVMRECLSISAFTKDLGSKGKGKNEQLSMWKTDWTDCVTRNLSKEETALNIKRQQEFRKGKMLELAKEDMELWELVSKPANRIYYTSY